MLNLKDKHCSSNICSLTNKSKKAIHEILCNSIFVICYEMPKVIEINQSAVGLYYYICVYVYYANIGKLYRKKSHLENLLDHFEQSRTSIQGIIIASHAVFR